MFETFLSKFVHEDLAQWETYCREYCLKLPNGFVMPEKVMRSSKNGSWSLLHPCSKTGCAFLFMMIVAKAEDLVKVCCACVHLTYANTNILVT